jgi:ABC-type uncharacterized transport system auxiliary subunit
MRYFLYIVGMLLFISGCATKVPAVTHYTLTPKVIPQKTNGSDSIATSLKVFQTFSDTTLMDTKMYYSNGFETNRYHQSKWLLAPNTMVSDTLVRNITNANIFQNVVGSNSRVQTTYILESRLDEFMQYFTPDMKHSYVVVQLSLAVVKKEGLSLVASKTFRKKVDVETLDAKGGVKALNEAMQEVVQEAVRWLGSVSYDK